MTMFYIHTTWRRNVTTIDMVEIITSSHPMYIAQHCLLHEATLKS